MIDTFDTGQPTNTLGGAANAWQGDPTDPNVRCEVAFDSETPRGTGRSLRLTYQITSPRENPFVPSDFSRYNPVEIHGQGFSGYYSLLLETDASRFRYLTFWVKGDPSTGFTRTLKLELKDPTDTASYLLESVTDRWERIVIPLSHFATLKDWSKLKEFTMVFDRTVTRPNGSVLFDDLALTTSPKEEPQAPTQKPLAETPPVPPFQYHVPARRQPPRAGTPFPPWEGLPMIHLRSPESLEWGSVSSPSELSAEVAAQWDFDALYLQVQVKDKDVVNPYQGADIWKGDCVEVYLTPHPESLEWGNSRDLQLGVAPTGPEGIPQTWAWFQGRRPSKTEVITACDVRPGGYTCEVAIRWAWLRVRLGPQEGQRFGFSVAVHDLDLRGAMKKEAKLNWRFRRSGQRVELGQLRLAP